MGREIPDPPRGELKVLPMESEYVDAGDVAFVAVCLITSDEVEVVIAGV